MARICVFCGGTPATREHAWPKWLVSLFPAQPIQAARTGASPHLYTSDSIELAVRVVCEECNNGWMSALENRAAGTLSRMIRGQSTPLDPPAQLAVAAWAVKTAMVMEHTLGLTREELFWTDEDRRTFREPPHVPPGETVVRIGGYGGTRLAYVMGGLRPVAPLGSGGKSAPGTLATLVAGRLVLQVESDRYEAVTGRKGWCWPPLHAGQTEWIYPIQHQLVTFPPGPLLNDATLDVFAGGSASP